MSDNTSGSERPASRTPWWFQALLGVIPLSLAIIYGMRAFSDETTGRDLIFGAIWLLLAAVWFLSAWVARRRGLPPEDR